MHESSPLFSSKDPPYMSLFFSRREYLKDSYTIYSENYEPAKGNAPKD